MKINKQTEIGSSCIFNISRGLFSLKEHVRVTDANLIIERCLHFKLLEAFHHSQTDAILVVNSKDEPFYALAGIAQKGLWQEVYQINIVSSDL